MVFGLGGGCPNLDLDVRAGSESGEDGHQSIHPAADDLCAVEAQTVGLPWPWATAISSNLNPSSVAGCFRESAADRRRGWPDPGRPAIEDRVPIVRERN